MLRKDIKTRVKLPIFRMLYSLALTNYQTTHVSRQHKGSVALKDCRLSPPKKIVVKNSFFFALPRNGMVSGNSVGKQSCTSPGLLEWVV